MDDYFCVLDPCENTNGQNYPAVITNPTFTGSATGWSLGLDWSYSANTVVGTSGSYANSTSVFEQNKYYKISITVVSIVGTLDVYIESVFLGSISSVGTHDFYGFADTLLSTGYLVICPQTDGATACLSNVTSFEILTEFRIVLYDSNV